MQATRAFVDLEIFDVGTATATVTGPTGLVDAVTRTDRLTD